MKQRQRGEKREQDPSRTANALMKMCGTVYAVIIGMLQSQITPFTQGRNTYIWKKHNKAMLWQPWYSTSLDF